MKLLIVNMIFSAWLVPEASAFNIIDYKVRSDLNICPGGRTRSEDTGSGTSRGR